MKSLFGLLCFLLIAWACSSGSGLGRKESFEYTSVDSVVFYSEFDISEIIYGAIQSEEKVVNKSCYLLLYLEFEKQVGGVSIFRYFKTRNMCKGNIENLDFDAVFEDLVLRSKQYEVSKRFESERLFITIPIHLRLP